VHLVEREARVARRRQEKRDARALDAGARVGRPGRSAAGEQRGERELSARIIAR
jgi:hypothetical protein